MKRVLMYAAFSLAAGILAQSLTEVCEVVFVFGGFLLFLGFCLLSHKYSAVILCIVMAASGYLYCGRFVSNIQRKADCYSGQSVFVRARVLDFYEGERSDYADLRTLKITKDGEDINQRINIRVYFYEKPEINYGDIVEFNAKLKRSANIIKSASRSDGALFYCTLAPSDIIVCGGKTSFLNPKDAAHFIREYAEKRIYEYLDGDSAALLLGVLTGNTQGLSETLRQDFRICGLSHITAVSGMHIGIILSLAMSAFAVLRIKRHKIAILFYIALVWFVALVAGLHASAVRASLMSTLFFISYLLKRDNDPINSLAAAAFIMLSVNPLVLFDLGFEFSVLATAGIIVISPLVSERIKPFFGFFTGFLSVPFSAQLVTLPLTVASFGTVPVLGLLANILICPLLPLVLALGIAFLVFSAVAPLAAALGVVLKVLLNIIIFVVVFIAKVPFASFNMRFNALCAVAYIIVCFSLYFWLLKKRTKALCSAALASAVFLIFISFASFSTEAYLSFVNVGNGDCTVFKAPKAVIMFDSGGRNDSDIGRKTVMPYLRREGISKVDIAFLTHGHVDHGRGFVPLLNDGIIKNIVLPSDFCNSGLYTEIEAAAQNGGANVYLINEDKSFDFCGILVEAVNTSDGDEENNGFVYFLTYGKNRVCITGDINKRAERKLCENASVSSNVLKVSHHGSATSSDGDFLEDVDAKFAVISCAGDKFPADKTIETLRDKGISFAATKECGNIEIEMDRNRFKIIRLERGSINEL